MKKFLIIQTAFIGDVILATPVVETLKKNFPDCTIDFVLRKGNEGLLDNHPHIRRVILWNKQAGKYLGLLATLSQVRNEEYDHVINLHRFFSSGMITYFARGKEKVGFDKNPLSNKYDITVPHEISARGTMHEVDRNLQLIEHLADDLERSPKLYPSAEDMSLVEQMGSNKYICIAPTSVWFTKQFPKGKWIAFIDQLPENIKVYLLGSNADVQACNVIQDAVNKRKIQNLAGRLSLLESAALMKGALMNYANDSAPQHLASAVNAPVTTVYASTVPEFGFSPLSDQSFVVQTKEKLECRPCGLHGHKKCPKGHFKCAHSIEVADLLNTLQKPAA